MNFDPTPLAWFNGEIVDRELSAPSIASHSLHLGIGVFDGMMAYWNKDHHFVFKKREHIRRFLHGSSKMDLLFKWSENELAYAIDEFLKNYSGKTLYIRPIAYRAAPQINITGIDSMPVDVSIFGVEVPPSSNVPIKCIISSYERISGNAIPVHWKICGAYVNSYLARRNAEKQGSREGVMLDQNGAITEGSAANIFFIQNKKLVTPKLTDDIFPGITRSVVIDIANKMEVEVEECTVWPEDINSFSGAFFTATLMEIAPIQKIGDTSFNTIDIALYKEIYNEFRRKVEC